MQVTCPANLTVPYLFIVSVFGEEYRGMHYFMSLKNWRREL
jgi:hypothetical protein